MERRTFLIEQILGKEFARAENAQGTTCITDWSPNNIKTVVIGWKHLFIEYHVMNKMTMKHGIKQKLMLHTFNEKQIVNWEHKKDIFKLFEAPRLLSAVEEIYILRTADYPSDLLQHDIQCLIAFTNDTKIKERFPRLRTAGLLTERPDVVRSVIERGRNKHLYYGEIFKNNQILYNNDDWWRYGESGFAPLRPKYYLFDKHPETVDGEATTDMLLHNCFTEVAKPYYEKEKQQKEQEQALKKINTTIQKNNKEYAGLDEVLEVLMPAAAQNDLFYNCDVSHIRNKQWCMGNLKIRRIAELTKHAYIYKRAGTPQDYKVWMKEHSKTNEYADDTLYDTYSQEYNQRLLKLQKLCNNTLLLDSKYGVFSNLLLLLRYALLEMLLPQTEHLQKAVLNAALYSKDSALYTDFVNKCKQETNIDLKALAQIKSEDVTFVYDLCKAYCYVVTLVQFEVIHIVANIRYNNPNYILGNIKKQTKLYLNPEDPLDLPRYYMYFDNYLLRLAANLPYIDTVASQGYYKSTCKYIPNIGAMKLNPDVDSIDYIIEHVTKNREKSMVQLSEIVFGLKSLIMLAQYFITVEGICLLKETGSDFYTKNVGQWYKISRVQFVGYVQKGIAAVHAAEQNNEG